MASWVSTGQSFSKKSLHFVSVQLGSRQLSKPSWSWSEVPEQLCQQTSWQSGMKVLTTPDLAGFDSSVAKAVHSL